MAPVIPFLPLIVAGIGAATAGVEIANQPSAPKAPDAQHPAQTTVQQAQASEAAAQAQATALAKRRGLASTILTSPMGAGAASTQKSTLGA